MGLAEYAAQHPQEMPEREREAIAATAGTVKDRLQERERADQLKKSILAQLQQGTAPQYILYAAVSAIGLLTGDAEWEATAKAALDAVYDDLAQMSLLTDTNASAAQRLQQLQRAYNAKLRQQLTRQQAGYKRIDKAISEALDALEALEAPFLQ